MKNKKQVLEYAQKAFAQGLMAGTSGNLSVCEDEKIFITPSSIDYMTMTEADIMVINFCGDILEGPHKPSSEWRLHAEIYANMPEVRSVVHTHSPYATAFAVINESIPVALMEIVFFLRGDVRVAPVAAQGSAEVGLGAVKALKDRGACLLQNHGVVSIGKNLAEAFIRAEYIEDAAKVYHLARVIGKPTLIPDDMVREMLNR
jgi:L-fuculose-phosphate aldolase/L-ribulose-5-phosphate 4-epimerase